jgi:hypothetical protein
MFGWVLAAVAAYMFASSANSGSKRKVTQGTAQLRAGRTYRFELSLDGDAVRKSPNPSDVARGLDNGLRMAGAYDVMVQPTIPILASYSMLIAGDLPIVLNVPATQAIGGIPGQYTFTSVQEIAGRQAAA